jgi:hypothetical protein
MASLIAEAALIQGVGTPVQEIIGRLNTGTDEAGPKGVNHAMSS